MDDLLARSNRLGRGPAQHQLRGRQHLGQGHRDRPGDRRHGRADVGQGVRRRPGHAHRGGAGGAAAGPAARAGRASTRASSARTRWSPRSTTACTAGAVRPRPSTPRCTGWSTPPHVDHLHPDSGIALATAADGEALTAECFGDRVVWVPWRRPGFQLGLDIAAIKAANPQAIGVILGGHGITAWGATSAECEANSLEIIRTARAVPGRARPGRAVRPGRARQRAAARGRAAGAGGRDVPDAARARLHRRPQVGHFTDSDVVLDFLARAEQPRRWPRSAPPARTTSCAPRCGRSSSTCRGTAPSRGDRDRLRELHAATGRTTAAYYERHADARTARRCAAPTRRSCWCPASACSPSARTSRPPGWPASSTSTRST